MKLSYFPDTDSLYIDLADRTSVESEEVAPGFVLDFDANGAVVGIDIENALGKVDLTRLESYRVPSPIITPRKNTSKGHELHKVKAMEIFGTHSLRLRYDDGYTNDIDFFPMLAGQIFGPLRDPEFFKQVRLNTECWNIEWPNEADFDPETLYYWDRYLPAWIKRAEEVRKKESE